MLIHEIFHGKPKTVLPDLTIRECLKKMRAADCNGFVVVDTTKKVVGVISLQDIAGAALPNEFKQNIGMARAMFVRGFFHEQCQEIADKPVKSLMRKDFVAVDLHTNILAVLADFLEHDLYLVPVIENKELKGVVTRSDVREALAKGMGLI